MAALARRLANLGASPEVIAIAVEAVTLASRDASRFVTVPERSGAAVRAARYRQKLKQHKGKAEANDAAKTGAEPRDANRDASRGGVTQRCDLLSIQEVDASDEGRKKAKKVNTEDARARGTRMVAGAILTDELLEAAITLGAPRDRVPDMWAEFVDYWIGVPGSRGLKLNWLATWRNRVRDVLSKGNRNGPRPRQQSLSDLAGDMAEQARRWERENGIKRPSDAI